MKQNTLYVYGPRAFTSPYLLRLIEGVGPAEATTFDVPGDGIPAAIYRAYDDEGGPEEYISVDPTRVCDYINERLGGEGYCRVVRVIEGIDQRLPRIAPQISQAS